MFSKLCLIFIIFLSLFSKGSFYTPFYGPTANGYSNPVRGWNSFGMQANPTVNPSFSFNQSNVLLQCLNLRGSDLDPGFDTVCSLDSGWSVGDHGDEFGRIIPWEDHFPNVTQLAEQLHERGILFGVYILPGAFNNDADKFVLNTNITIGSLFNRTEDPSGQTCNSFLARSNFNFSQPGVREWHESVIEQFAKWGVDFIKLDFITPGSPEGGCLPYDSSKSVEFYHNAIAKSGRRMRLDISWKLDRTGELWTTWKSNADTLRTDQDLNNANAFTYVKWEIVQRAINHYRLFINEQVDDPSRHGFPIQIRPDMDNMFVGNRQTITGLNDRQRYSVAIHWHAAGAKLVTGSDLTRIDALGEELLWNEEASSIAKFCSQWPMQPKNPEDWKPDSPGGNAASQFQAWIAGPNGQGEAVIVLANYGPDLGQGGFNTHFTGIHNVNITFNSLGIGDQSPGGSRTWSVRRVWGNGEDHSGPWIAEDILESNLGEGESVLYKITKV